MAEAFNRHYSVYCAMCLVEIMLGVKRQVSFNRTRLTGTLHEDPYTFLIISRSDFLRMRNVSENL
jgi:hypothetical protein